MKKRTNNPDFVYEISCDQMCGSGHFSMRGVIVVESEADYKKWIAEQTPEYLTLNKKTEVPVVADTTAKSTPLAQVTTK